MPGQRQFTVTISWFNSPTGFGEVIAMLCKSMEPGMGLDSLALEQVAFTGKSWQGPHEQISFSVDHLDTAIHFADIVRPQILGKFADITFVEVLINNQRPWVILANLARIVHICAIDLNNSRSILPHPTLAKVRKRLQGAALEATQ